MTDEPDWFFLRRFAARRNEKRFIMDTMLQIEVSRGTHVHLADQDGDWCLDGSCEDTATIYARDDGSIWPARQIRGLEPSEVILDEIADFDYEWKDTA